MTLRDALAALGAPLSNPGVEDVRNAAARVVMAALEKLGKAFRCDPDLVADACNHVLLAIVARGKRDFESDEHARGYLGKAIRNRCVDAFRRRRREVAFDDVREGAVVDWSAADDSDAAAASAREQGAREAWARLEAEARIVADAMRPADRGGAFLQCFDELRALALETTTIDAVIRARPKVEGESPTPAALHQQHHRCRERLMQQIDHRETTGEIDPAMAEYLRNAVRFLKRRT